MTDSQTDPAPQFTLTLDAFGTVTATASAVRHRADSIAYTVHGHRLQGVFTLRPISPADPLEALTRDIGAVIVSYGLADDRAPQRWAHRPEVNGTSLIGSNTVLLTQIPDLQAEQALHPLREANNFYGHDRAPAGARAKTTAVVAGLLADFLAREDLPELQRAVCAHAATDAIYRAYGRIETLDKRIRTAQTQRRAVLEELAALQRLAHGEQPTAENGG
ncbi:hypothetical protein AB0C65_38570 [Nocardia sp. NPDC048505]|uniref:hypothetical protein n=1 Tax=Nocardia sp. NPDC048505 TaxID=3155756 RepID=UPI00340D4652